MVLASLWESCPQLINMRANPLHQLFQPLKSLILKTLSSSSSLAESESISVATQMLQPPLKATSLQDCSPAHWTCSMPCCFILFFSRLSAFYEQKEQKAPFFARVQLCQAFVHPSLCPNERPPCTKLDWDLGVVHLKLIRQKIDFKHRFSFQNRYVSFHVQYPSDVLCS